VRATGVLVLDDMSIWSARGGDIPTIGDLATMKVFAIGGRSEKKDFVDLHVSLTDFSLAEPTIMPKMLKTQGRSWPVIKRHLEQWAAD
jgi:hypothetical protein